MASRLPALTASMSRLPDPARLTPVPATTTTFHPMILVIVLLPVSRTVASLRDATSQRWLVGPLRRADLAALLFLPYVLPQSSTRPVLSAKLSRGLPNMF